MTDLAFPGHLTQDDPDLTARHREVFVSLVALHRATARPVGSETLAHHAAVRLSPASIRGALGELEAMGLLERHYSSSGRQPSARGFEYFVRALSLPQELPTSLAEEIRLRLARSAHDVEALLDEASRLLSSITHQLGLAVASTLEGELLDRLDLEALGGAACSWCSTWPEARRAASCSSSSPLDTTSWTRSNPCSATGSWGCRCPRFVNGSRRIRSSCIEAPCVW
jgi:hypothetical protein